MERQSSDVTCTQRKPDSRSTSLHWNSARCARLLRSIATKIASLRLSVEADTAQGPLSANGSDGNSTIPKTTEEDTTVWSQWGAKRVKKKYGHGRRVYDPSTRAGIEASHNTAGQINVETPFLKRARDHSGFEDHSSIKITVQGLSRAKRRKRQHFEPQQALAGLLNAFDAVLEATAPSCLDDRKPRSLVAACLRNIPAFIADDIAYRKLMDNEDRSDKTDVASETFQDLEMCPFGSKWLPVATRAQALSMIKDAVLEGLFSSEQLEALVEVAARRRAYDVGDDLILTFISIHPALTHPTHCADDLFSPLISKTMSVLAHYSHSFWRIRVLFRGILQLIVAAKLPLTWLATDPFKPIWNLVIRSLTDGSGETSDASALLESFLVCAAGVDPSQLVDQGIITKDPCFRFKDQHSELDDLDSALCNTISSICTILTSVAQLSTSNVGETHSQTIYPLRSAAEHVMASYHSQAVRSAAISTALAAHGGLILGADVMLRCLLNESMKTRSLGAEMKILGFLHGTTGYEASGDLSSLAVAIARCCDRAEHGHGLALLQKLGEKLGEGVTETSIFMYQLHSDAAMLYAKYCNRSDALQYAFDTEETANRFRPDTPQSKMPTVRFVVDGNLSGETPQQRRPQVGYRWEEGLSEWVANSPVTSWVKENSKDDGSRTKRLPRHAVKMKEESSFRHLEKRYRTPHRQQILSLRDRSTCELVGSHYNAEARDTENAAVSEAEGSGEDESSEDELALAVRNQRNTPPVHRQILQDLHNIAAASRVSAGKKNIRRNVFTKGLHLSNART